VSEGLHIVVTRLAVVLLRRVTCGGSELRISLPMNGSDSWGYEYSATLAPFTPLALHICRQYITVAY